MNAKERKEHPVFSGVLKYFPKALMAVANCSWRGNEQHNPGEPLYWNRAKSTDEPDALVRHLMEAGTLDTDGVRHSTKVAWRALAMLEKELEAAEQRNLAVPNLMKERVQQVLDGLKKKKAPISEEKRAYGEAIGQWVPGAAGYAAWVAEHGEGVEPPPLPESCRVEHRFGPDTELHPSLKYVPLLPSPPPGSPSVATLRSRPQPLCEERPVGSIPSRPSSHHASAPGPDGYSEGLGDA